MDFVTKENKDAYFTANELAELRQTKIDAKISDVDYMKAHPEIEQSISLLYRSVLSTKPSNSELYSYVAKFFIDLNIERHNAMN